VLTGIRLGRYGISSSGGRVGHHKGGLVPLLKDILKVRGDFRIRLSSLEITEVDDELLRLAASDDKICPNLHLPLQSGDDAVLKRMGRWYSSGFYCETVGKVRDLLPDAGVTADVIVGFPGETDLNFANTVRVIESTVNGLHVFPYSPRPGTAAVRLKEKTDGKLSKERARILLQMDRGLRRTFQNRFAGKKRMVLAESDGGFTDNGIRVPVPKSAREGALVLVKIPAVA
jgi:threonylcarbamoyladenosine tRNA methylthiotransferase MtaB